MILVVVLLILMNIHEIHENYKFYEQNKSWFLFFIPTTFVCFSLDDKITILFGV